MPKATLPSSISLAEYTALRSDPRRWEPIVSEIAGVHALGGEALRPVEAGSNLIALLGDDRVIKLFPPFLRHQYESERLALRHVQARLSVPTPEVIVDGEIAGWPYLIITRLGGVALGTIWDACSELEKRTILHAIGELAAEVQTVPPGTLTDLAPRWDDFLVQQAARCRIRHERLLLPPHLLADLDRYLGKTRNAISGSFRPVVLTGEYTPENVLVTRRSGAWRISGLIDFGDAMVGFGEYDLLGPGTFLASGDAQRLRALLLGFGYVDPSVISGLSQRLMRMLLLHRYSDLHAQVKIDAWQSRARDLDELEALLWPLGGSG